MALTETKKTLFKMRVRFKDLLADAKADIKPNLTAMGLSGYSYQGIDDKDRDFIYESICFLMEAFRDYEGPIVFDIENHYITEKLALRDLKTYIELHRERYLKLQEMKPKYCTPHGDLAYPLEVCLSYFRSIGEILDEISASDEVRVFENPRTFEQVQQENIELRFANLLVQTQMELYRASTRLHSFSDLRGVTHRVERKTQVRHGVLDSVNCDRSVYYFI